MKAKSELQVALAAARTALATTKVQVKELVQAVKAEKEKALQDKVTAKEAKRQEAIRKAQAMCKGKSPMGMRRVLSQKVFKARKAKSTTRPLCRAQCLERFKEYMSAYFYFRGLFLEASARLRQAVHSGAESVCVCFPEGGVPLFGGRLPPPPS